MDRLINKNKKEKPDLETQRVLGLKSENPERFQEWVKQYHSLFYSLVISIVRNPDNAEDVMQEGWLEIYESIHRLNNPERFRNWAYTILRRKAFDNLRISKRERRIVDPEKIEMMKEQTWITGNTSIGYNSKEMVVRLTIMEALWKLPIAQREAVTLHLLEGYSQEDTAEILGISVGAVEQRIHRSRDFLFVELKELKK
jgi:RNA polymerase sigma factor (sigma-70 family)